MCAPTPLIIHCRHHWFILQRENCIDLREINWTLNASWTQTRVILFKCFIVPSVWMWPSDLWIYTVYICTTSILLVNNAVSFGVLLCRRCLVVFMPLLQRPGEYAPMYPFVLSILWWGSVAASASLRICINIQTTKNLAWLFLRVTLNLLMQWIRTNVATVASR